MTLLLSAALFGCSEHWTRFSEPRGGPTDSSLDAISTPAAAQPAVRVGFHQDLLWGGSLSEGMAAIEAAADLGARVSRNSLLWHLIEPERGKRDWSWVDAILTEIERAGLIPLLVIYGSPTWANGVPKSTDRHYLHVPTDPEAFDAWLAEYRDFARELVLRYRHRVHHWQLWNEPQGHFFWKPKPDLDRYVAFYTTLKEVFDEHHPSAKVSTGPVTSLTAKYPGDYSGLEFLEGLYDRGVRPQVVSIHPYAAQNQAPDEVIAWENNFTDVGKVEELIHRRDPSGAEIWVTEWGWSLDSLGEATQADYVERSLQMLAELWPSVTLATYFMDRDAYGYRYGVRTSDLRLREAGVRFRNFVK